MGTLLHASLFLAAFSAATVAQTDLQKCTYTSKEGKVYDLSPLITSRQARESGRWAGLVVMAYIRAFAALDLLYTHIYTQCACRGQMCARLRIIYA